MINTVIEIIKKSSNEEISNNIIETYLDIEKGFFIKKWKTSELESGHFVESIRRFLEYKLFGIYTPFNKSIGSFNNTELNRYERSKGKEEYRIIIPRLLYSVYCIRNKRGVGHISSISPNKQDASYILSSCKWILAEIVRIESNLDPDKTTGIIDRIIKRQIEGIWEDGQIKRILIEKLSLKEKILILTFDKSPILFNELIKIIEYDNLSYFRKLLKEMHSERLLEYNEICEDCYISPKGVIVAEKLIVEKYN